MDTFGSPCGWTWQQRSSNEAGDQRRTHPRVQGLPILVLVVLERAPPNAAKALSINTGSERVGYKSGPTKTLETEQLASLQ